MKEDIFNVDFIPIFDWTIIRDHLELSNLQKNNEISNDYKIIGTDILGDIIATRQNKLYVFSHEESTEEPLLLSDNLPQLQHFVETIISLPDYSINTPLPELRNIKKKLLEIKKNIDDNLKGYIEEEIDNIKELVSDWKFYQSDEGKRYLITEKFKDEFYKSINRPIKYRRIEVERDFECSTIKIVGYFERENETLEELKEILETINCELPVVIGSIFTFEEYKKALEKNSLTVQNQTDSD